MTDEIRRRKTQDPEMDALVVLHQALEPLDRPAAKRVLAWADERYVNPADPVPLGSVNKFLEALATTAREMHVSPPGPVHGRPFRALRVAGRLR
jgi:hypothetical protein